MKNIFYILVYLILSIIIFSCIRAGNTFEDSVDERSSDANFSLSNRMFEDYSIGSSNSWSKEKRVNYLLASQSTLEGEFKKSFIKELSKYLGRNNLETCSSIDSLAIIDSLYKEIIVDGITRISVVGAMSITDSTYKDTIFYKLEKILLFEMLNSSNGNNQLIFTNNEDEVDLFLQKKYPSSEISNSYYNGEFIIENKSIMYDVLFNGIKYKNTLISDAEIRHEKLDCRFNIIMISTLNESTKI